MTLRSTTDLPDALVRAIVRFIRPANVTGFSLTVRNTSSWHPHGHAAPRASRSHIVASIPTRQHVTASAAHGAYLPMPPRTRVEALVVLLAHEARHLWQGAVPRGYRVWGARGQFSERDADAYALRMLRAWRRATDAERGVE